jgi:hypothetical protein|nr:MAG TPA: tail assembly chaperone protein [Caudoviricetes sp.]
MVTTFEAGGKLYELRYSFNALCEFEEKYDIGVSEALANRKSFYYLRGLLWSGMLAKQKLTVEQVGDILDAYLQDGHELGDLLKLLTEALQAAGFFHTVGSKSGKKAAAQEKSEKPSP